MKKEEKGDFTELEHKIGYGFKDKAMLRSALTHPSYRFENTDADTDNQRLEFLGDAALGFVAALHLYRVFGDVDEGELTLKRSRITSGKALAEIGGEIDLGRHVLMGKGELQSGGQTRESTLADAFEAIVGAGFLDGGMRAVQRIFNTLLRDRIEELDREDVVVNPKGRLQEYSQRVFKDQPEYSLKKEKGPAHRKTFICDVTLKDGSMAEGSGKTKQEAEAQAAHILIRRIHDDDAE